MRTGAIDMRLVYGAIAALWLGVTGYTMIVPQPPYRAISSREAIARFTVDRLQNVQLRSLDENREFCGVILESAEGKLESSQIYEGDRGACAYDRLAQPGMHVVAGFHTHGGVDPAFDSEFPSIEDIAGDVAQRTDGYIATPGGRVWQSDWREGTVRQFCGEGCVKRDQRYDTKAGETPKQSYSIGELRRRYDHGSAPE